MDDKELHNLLFSAVQHHNDSLLDDLLGDESGRRLLDSPGEDGNMLLHAAVLENSSACVECLLKHGSNPNVFDTIRARTPLHLAVEFGFTDVVKAFLELEHINLDIRDDRNLTCCEIAQFCDNQTLADLIKLRQDEIDQAKYEFYSIMNQACTSNQANIVKELLEKYERRILEKLPKGWLQDKDAKQFARANIKELLNWSSSSWNDVTLLFKSASKGHVEICKLLIEFGATAKCNENTNYSPLYVAAYGGFTETVKLLLDSFPSLVREVTIEKWTVLHACCLQGHSETAKLILNYPYSEELKNRYVSRSGLYEYYFAFDLNAQDAAGQTVIYLAVSANDEKLLDTLLHFNLQAKLLNLPKQSHDTGSHGIQIAENLTKSQTSSKHARIIPDRPKLIQNQDKESSLIHPNSNLDKIIKQLRRITTKDSNDDKLESSRKVQNSEKKYLICPFEMDTYCDYNSKTALHLAVYQQYHSIATTLLVNGSNPNLPILSRDSIKSDFSNSNTTTGLNWLRSSKSTCLKEACRLNDEYMCEILIRYGASDNQDNLALQVAAMNKNSLLISKFLALKSNVDPEFRINKKCNVEFASRYKQSQKLSKSSSGNITTTFSSMFPSSPVMIDWQNLKCINQIDPQWLIDASLQHNKRLKHPTTSLLAITRLDMSSNNLKSIHPVIFRLPSLRELNLSKNRLESLFDFNQRGSFEVDTIPTTKLIESHRIAMKRSKSTNLSSINLESSNIIDLNEPQEWDLPCLETLDLHDNRLLSLPDCLFELPRLSELDVSSNQIRQLPWLMWTAPSLKEVIASGNLLDDLPRLPSQVKQSVSPSLMKDCRDSPDEKSSLISNNSAAAIDQNEGSFSSITESELNRDQSFTQNLDVSDMQTIQLDSSNLSMSYLNYWKKKIDLVSSGTSIESKSSNDNLNEGNNFGGVSKITYLNLSHNSFAHLPPVLACVATELSRLNLSYNRINSLGDIGLYPAKLKNIDLSNNQIDSWFTVATLESDLKQCYAESSRRDSTVSKFLHNHSWSQCVHKIHQRLENLKSINLSYNMLRDIKIALNPLLNMSNHSRNSSSSKGDVSPRPATRDLLFYPNITALDLSFNKIQQVPKCISDLKDISVLNLSGNVIISSLPAELGLASKLWNLSINGCNLNEPLKSVVESKTYKTMDIIGYLRSILEEAKPYARMKLMLVGLQGIGKTSLLEQMRQEGSTGSKRRPPEHWTRRMGHTTKSNLRNQKGVTLSTVGVDIHDWIFCKRTPRNQPNYGPVSFSTWDFGGQHEFYATHRYFLSKRSMYLVVWRLTDGIQGILGIQQWLVNIQSRASGSPVIIVGTHEDMIEGGEKGEKVQELQAEVHKRFINVYDHDKCGLPRVMDSIVVSTKTKLNIKNLCNRIYDIVFSLKCPGSMERLLEQKIPATYLYLEEIVNWVVNDRHQKRREPVLNYDDYKRITSEQLKTKYNKVFRDLEPLNSREINYNSELQQATRFLHENGILLHYEDANLRDLYFLDPQWLCDILSHVVTIREINPHIKNGLMKIDDLSYLFKSVDVNLSGGVQSYVVNLLNKFEVALTWNSQYLLIPSLLPSDPQSIGDRQDFHVKMAPRIRGRSTVRRFEHNKSTARSTSIEPTRVTTNPSHVDEAKNPLKIDIQTEKTTIRLVLLRYLPAGFLARLQSGILSDPTYDEVCSDLYSYFTQNLKEDENNELNKFIGGQAGWTCWKNGIKLALQQESTINSRPHSSNLQAPLLTVQELSTTSNDSFLTQEKFKVEFAQVKPGVKDDPDSSDCVELLTTKWCDFDMNQYSNILLISVHNWRLRLSNSHEQTQLIELDQKCVAKLLACTVDHIDNLLEDWYPSLGTRFAHTLGGSYLVTRIIPCTDCYATASISKNSVAGVNQRSSRLSSRASRNQASLSKPNFTISSARNTNSSVVSEGILADTLNEMVSDSEIYCYYVENCIFSAYNIASKSLSTPAQRKYSLNIFQSSTSKEKKPTQRRTHLSCPKHGLLSINSIAPDIVFDDILDCYKIDSDQLERCKLIGRGTFGFVFRGSLRNASSLIDASSIEEVALKLLQPVDPGPEADHTDVIAYKSAKSNWTREPFHCACKSYCTARHEVNILQTLRHPNIVHFIGICVKPLAIVLELAPLGCLTDVFKNFKRAGMRIDQYSIQKTISQVARALEFLHQQRVIYRDLKAENVLVWNFPSPFATQVQNAHVDLKLADYGISRQALSTGIYKGFAGTINFLAPEILRHNGDEEYTEKVDCFSFGMFIYELLTLRPPYKHNEGTKSHLAEGLRPTLTIRDLIYPNYIFDLMSICWSQEPHHRPTASQIVSIASTPEFMQLLDVVALTTGDKFRSIGAIQYIENDYCNLDFWLGRNLKFEVLSADQGHWVEYQRLVSQDNSLKLEGVEITCMCVVENNIWFCDSNKTIHITPLGFRSYQKEYRSNQVKLDILNDTLNRFQSFPLKLQTSDRSYVQDMIFVNSAHCVIFLLSNGQLWLCQLGTMFCKQLDDDSISFKCMAIQENLDVLSHNRRSPTNDEKVFHIFCGQQNGISCLEISNEITVRQSILPLADKLVDLSGERIVEPSQSTEVTLIVTSKNLLWTSAGCTVHLWSIKEKCVARKLDCWKLVPCSESLESFNIESYNQQARSSTVSSLVYSANQLFVGTSHGCFMVVEADSLKPMIVFRPYESNIKILTPTLIRDNNDKDELRYLVTVGTGYRDLMKRYVNSLDYELPDGTETNSEVAILWSANYYNI